MGKGFSVQYFILAMIIIGVSAYYILDAFNLKTDLVLILVYGIFSSVTIIGFCWVTGLYKCWQNDGQIVEIVETEHHRTGSRRLTHTDSNSNVGYSPSPSRLDGFASQRSSINRGSPSSRFYPPRSRANSATFEKPMIQKKDDEAEYTDEPPPYCNVVLSTCEMSVFQSNVETLVIPDIPSEIFKNSRPNSPPTHLDGILFDVPLSDEQNQKYMNDQPYWFEEYSSTEEVPGVLEPSSPTKSGQEIITVESHVVIPQAESDWTLSSPSADLSAPETIESLVSPLRPSIELNVLPEEPLIKNTIHSGKSVDYPDTSDSLEELHSVYPQTSYSGIDNESKIHLFK